MSTRDEPGTACTLHFDPPYRPDAPAYKCAGHYTGWALDLEERLADHEAGRGARLTQVQKEAGGSWRLASAEPGTRADERRLKQHGAARRCPICQRELEERRLGPGGRSHFADPRPGDFPGRKQEAEKEAKAG
jgi:hypothetical protein